MAGLFTAANKQHNPLGSAVHAAGSGRYTFGLALSAGLAGLLYGYDTVSISGAIEFLSTRYQLGLVMQGLVISSIIIGAVIGAASAGFLSDRFGRKRILMVGGMFYLAASMWSAWALGPFDLIAARIVGGYGIGLTAALAVTYITESAPTAIRGTLAFSYQMLTVCGIFMTNVINYVIASYGTYSWDLDYGWRWMLGLGGIPAVIFVLAMWHAPESPRYLIQHGRLDEGFSVLEQIVGTQKARVRTDDIMASVELEHTMSDEFTSLFRPGLRKALVIGIFLAVFNQAIGMNAISYYGPVMFSRMGFGGDTEFLAAACVGGIELTFTVVGLYLIDSVGRKRLMTVGSLLMTLFAGGIAVSYFMNRPLLALVFVMMFAASFAVSMGPIPWIVIPELFPTFLRGRATGLCVMCLLIVNGLIAQFTPLMIDHLGGGITFSIFTFIDLVCLIGVLVLVPETMGRTLEDIDRMWQPHTELASAHYALSSADANIRHAKATLVRIENERAQALGILDAARYAKADAQQRIAIIETSQQEVQRKARQEATQQKRTFAGPIPMPGPDDAGESGLGQTAAGQAAGMSAADQTADESQPSDTPAPHPSAATVPMSGTARSYRDDGIAARINALFARLDDEPDDTLPVGNGNGKDKVRDKVSDSDNDTAAGNSGTVDDSTSANDTATNGTASSTANGTGGNASNGIDTADSSSLSSGADETDINDIDDIEFDNFDDNDDTDDGPTRDVRANHAAYASAQDAGNADLRHDSHNGGTYGNGDHATDHVYDESIFEKIFSSIGDSDRSGDNYDDQRYGTPRYEDDFSQKFSAVDDSTFQPRQAGTPPTPTHHSMPHVAIPTPSAPRSTIRGAGAARNAVMPRGASPASGMTAGSADGSSATANNTAPTTTVSAATNAYQASEEARENHAINIALDSLDALIRE